MKDLEDGCWEDELVLEEDEEVEEAEEDEEEEDDKFEVKEVESDEIRDVWTVREDMVGVEGTDSLVSSRG